MSIAVAIITSLSLKNIDPSVVMAVHKKAKQYHIDPIVYHALIMNESSYKPGAVNKAGNKGVKISSFGIGQLTKSTAKWFCGISSEDDLVDVEKNLDCSARYFSWQIKRYKGDLFKAISAYNAGSYVTWNKWYNEKVEHYIKKLRRTLE